MANDTKLLDQSLAEHGDRLEDIALSIGERTRSTTGMRSNVSTVQLDFTCQHRGGCSLPAR